MKKNAAYAVKKNAISAFFVFVLCALCANTSYALNVGASPSELVFEHSEFNIFGEGKVEKQLTLFNPNDFEVFVYLNASASKINGISKIRLDKSQLRIAPNSSAKVIAASAVARTAAARAAKEFSGSRAEEGDVLRIEFTGIENNSNNSSKMNEISLTYTQVLEIPVRVSFASERTDRTPLPLWAYAGVFMLLMGVLLIVLRLRALKSRLY